MKGKLVRAALTMLALCMLTVSTLSPAYALSWDGSSSGGGGGTSPTSPGGYAVRYANAESCVVGYRFSVINNSGTTKGLVIDVYKGSGGFNNPKFSSKYNKADLIRRQNNGWSTSTSTYLCIKQSELGISLPAPSGMGVWQEKKSNLNPILREISPSLSVDNLIYGDKVLVEPIIEIAIAGTYHSFTVTEMALYGKHMLGVNSNGGSSSNSGSWGFIATYTNKNFPNLLRASDGYGIWTGVGSALTRQATFYDIINSGYGVGVAYTQMQNKAYTLTVNYYSNSATSGKAYNTTISGLGEGKQVLVYTDVIKSTDARSNGLTNYTSSSSQWLYLARSGYTGTGYWKTSSGYSVHQDTAFSDGATLAKALGVDLSSGNKTVNVYAQWTANRLTINYYSNGASSGTYDGKPLDTIEEGKNVFVRSAVFYSNTKYDYGLANYTNATSTYISLQRSGYSGTGYWGTMTSGGKLVHQDTAFSNGLDLAKALGVDISTGNKTVNLYAQWKQVSYLSNIDHWAWGFAGEGTNAAGTGYMLTSTKDYYPSGEVYVLNNSQAIEPPNGYYTRQQFGTRFLSDDLTTWGWYPFGTNVTQISQSMWFQYDYYPYTYNITYELNGGINHKDNPDTYTVLYGVTLKDPVRAGYTFAGWYIGDTRVTGINSGADANFSSSQELYDELENRTTGDVTVTARWISDGYTIKFNGNGATSGSTASMSMKYDEAKTLTANGFTRTGYTFTGWNTKADGSGTGYSDQQVVKNLTSVSDGVVTLYAQWKANSYTIRFDGNGATGGSTASMSMTYDVAKNLTANGYTRPGYTFTGWNIKADGSGTGYSDQQVVKNLTSVNGGVVTLYAQWKANSYTIRFDGNGATGGSTASMSMTYDVAKNLTANGYTRPGYTFTGWNTKADGSGISYTDRQLVKNLTGVNDGVVTLYAQWKANGYTIKFNGNGATSGSTASMSMTYDVAKNLTANGYTRPGYTFTGWNTKADGSGTSYTDRQLVKNLTSVNGGTVTLYAQWKANSYTIRFDGNGATGGNTVSMSMQFDEDRELSRNGFVRTRYVFVGWNTRADGTGTWYSDGQRVRNLTSVNGGVVTLYAQWQESLTLEPIAPNAAYREGTEVITSYWLINDSDRDYIPDDNVTLRFDVTYEDGTSYQSITKDQVVVPGEERNLIYIKWTIPTHLHGEKMNIRVTLVQYGGEEVVATRLYTTSEYTICQTEDTQFEYSAPEGLYGTAPAAQGATVTWSEFVYEDGDFVEKKYQFRLLAREFELIPESESAAKHDGVWTMKSGYGFSCAAQPLEVAEATTGRVTPTSEMYTMPQYSYMLYPEYGYIYGADTCTTLTQSAMPTFPEFLDYGKLHFTPIWYPDGAYTVAVVSSDCWTPMGMVKTTSTQTLQIQGSVYDDWYVGRK